MADTEINVLYTDKWLTVCSKPQGVDSEKDMPDLLSRQLGGDIYCVHRLDKATGGLIVYARGQEAAAALHTLVSQRAIRKEYSAVVQGRPEPPSGQMRDLLYRDARQNKSYVVKRMRRGVKEAELAYSLRASCRELSLVDVHLITGRTHQIRVQFASRGMPLAGDLKYGSLYRTCPLALWSCRLAFTHPFTGEALDLSDTPPHLWPWTEFEKS